MKNYLEKLKEVGLLVPKLIPQTNIDNSKGVFQDALDYFLSIENKTMTLLPEYNKICEWLTDNHNTGLMLIGNCGVGKTFITRYVIPAIFYEKKKVILRVYDDMNKNIDEIITKKYVVLDDVGTEEVSNSFGNKRLAFAEIVDNAEKNGNMLIITTNLSGDQLKEKYGLRVYDRLLKITTSIVFNQKSLR